MLERKFQFFSSFLFHYGAFLQQFLSRSANVISECVCIAYAFGVADKTTLAEVLNVFRGLFHCN